jgi:hypothetical protein
MTKGAALQAFFERFLPSYAASAVPNDVTFPYLTYELITDAWDGGEVGITVNLRDYTTKEAPLNAKAQELSNAIGLGGVTLPCDDGFIWLKRGSPWCQSLYDASDSHIKRRYLNVTAEYMTLN